MIKIERVVTPSPEQWEAIIRGMRNPMNSWDKSDSVICKGADGFEDCTVSAVGECPRHEDFRHNIFCVGANDLLLMEKLVSAGTDHRKFMRMIPVFMDITAPLYWWKEYDTYKVGTVANSCSTMHKIHDRELDLKDFSAEKLDEWSITVLEAVINRINYHRNRFIETKDKNHWEQMIQLLPSSYNQMRTCTLNYEVLKNMYRARKNHKLMEWREFCERIEKLPYSNLITG